LSTCCTAQGCDRPEQRGKISIRYKLSFQGRADGQLQTVQLPSLQPQLVTGLRSSQRVQPKRNPLFTNDTPPPPTHNTCTPNASTRPNKPRFQCTPPHPPKKNTQPQALKPTFKVRVYAQLGGKTRGGGGGGGSGGSGGSYACNSAESNVVTRTPQQVGGWGFIGAGGCGVKRRLGWGGVGDVSDDCWENTGWRTVWVGSVRLTLDSVEQSHVQRVVVYYFSATDLTLCSLQAISYHLNCSLFPPTHPPPQIPLAP